MIETAPSPAPTNVETLFGGKVEERCTFRDGTVADVRVHQLPFDDYPELLKVLGDEARMLEMYCRQPAGWSKTLTPETYDRLVTEAERINADFFSRWARRHLQRMERLMPGISERLLKNISATSPAASPNAPSPAATPLRRPVDTR